MNIGTLVEELRVHTEALRESGVERVELAGDGRALVHGAGFALLLGDQGEGTGFAGLLNEPGAVEVARLALPEPSAVPASKPAKAHRAPAPTSEREVVCGAEREDGATCGRMRPLDRGHKGRHGSWSESRAERVNRMAEAKVAARRGPPPVYFEAPRAGEPCPKCGRTGAWDLEARDEFGAPDPHCVPCGARPRREPEEIHEPGKRRRSPSHSGGRL